MEEDIAALVDEARKLSLDLGPRYTQNDLDRFFRWLVYGRPWSDHLAMQHAPEEAEPPLPASMLRMFRTWIMHMMEVLSTNLQAPEGNSESDTRNFARLRRFWAKDWQWDPWARPSALAQSVQITTPNKVAHQVGVETPDGEALPLPDPPSVVPTTHANTAAPHRGGSDEKLAMSETPHDYTGKGDFVVSMNRSRANSEA
jgi:hypothetical protein